MTDAERWEQVEDRITSQRISLGNFLSDVRVQWQPRTATLFFRVEQKFHKHQAEKDENKAIIEKAFFEVLGDRVEVIFKTEDEGLDLVEEKELL